MRRHLLARLARAAAVLLAAAALPWADPAAAAALPAPAGKVVLEVTGAVGNRNAGDAAAFDVAMLEGLGVVRLRTRTPWTEGETLFEGVPLNRVLEAAGARGTVAGATALNGYRVDMPLGDELAARAVLAFRANGKPMRVRDKGPLWIVFPWSEEPALDRGDVKVRSVWQLRELRIR